MVIIRHYVTKQTTAVGDHKPADNFAAQNKLCKSLIFTEITEMDLSTLNKCTDNEHILLVIKCNILNFESPVVFSQSLSHTCAS